MLEKNLHIQKNQLGDQKEDRELRGKNKMDFIDKEQFMENFEGEFEGNDQKGYLYKGFFVSASEIYDATYRMATDCGELHSRNHLEHPEHNTT